MSDDRTDAAFEGSVIACPGCGAALPASDWPVDGRTNASPGCLELRARVMEFEAEHMVELGRLHQLTIDAYGAQHGGPAVPAIAVPFGLVGLHLALDLDWRGDEVRAAHQFLAQAASRTRGSHSTPAWPTFRRPTDVDWLTIADVAGARSTKDHAQRVDRWARSVWLAWAPERDRVMAWADAKLSAEVRAQIRGR